MTSALLGLSGGKAPRRIISTGAIHTLDVVCVCPSASSRADCASRHGPHAPSKAGHSLGGALSELTAVWASTVWPNATVLNANTGAPRVGNEDWELQYRSVVGRGYRYVNHLDEVPTLPPLDAYVQVPEGLWLRDGLVLLQASCVGPSR